VWFAPEGDSYYLFSAGNAGKVKRLRNFSESRIAPCTMRGILTGDWIDTNAHLLESEEDQQTALRALRRKYGWQMYLGDFFSVLTGKMGKRAYIRVDLAQPVD
jgi:PPOX class probable F420-dependent enzyme